MKYIFLILALAVHSLWAQGPFLVFHGTSDSHISMKDFAALAEELDKNKLSHELITFGGASHAFTVFESPAYRES